MNIALAPDEFAYGSEVAARREIFVDPDRMAAVVDQSEAALASCDVPIFSRGGSLVRLVEDEVDGTKGRKVKALRFKDLDRAFTVDVLSKCARFYKKDRRRKDGEVYIPPPGQVADAILARDGYWRLPPIAGVSLSPIIRRDGSIADRPGYEPENRLYIAVDAKLPAIPDRPTRADAAAAKRVLDELLAEFPFVGSVDRSVALSALLTAPLRPSMQGAPLHAFRAHTPGTGKSYLSDLPSMLATGRPAPVISSGWNVEELEKRLGSVVLAGRPICVIDNVNGELGGDFLCQVTERTMVEPRILGQSKSPEMPCGTFFMANGNNLVIKGDMTRRTVLCNLDAGVERPELREFKGNPIEAVAGDRGRYLAAVYTIARAYMRSGERVKVPTIGDSYADWSRMVREPLVWLGEVDPVDSMEALRNEDPVLSDLRELLEIWESKLGIGDRYTAAQIAAFACEQFNGDWVYPEFRDLLLRIAGDKGTINTRKLGNWLQSRNGRLVGDRKIERLEKLQGAIQYRLIRKI